MMLSDVDWHFSRIFVKFHKTLATEFLIFFSKQTRGGGGGKRSEMNVHKALRPWAGRYVSNLRLFLDHMPIESLKLLNTLPRGTSGIVWNFANNSFNFGKKLICYHSYSRKNRIVVAEVYLKPIRTSSMELFAKMVDCF